MPSTPDTSELPPTTGQQEGFNVPKPQEPKPPEQPISPGAQRIIDSIRNGQGVPREVLGNIAGEKPASKKTIDMVKGPDGKWKAIVTPQSENPTGTDAKPQTSSESGNAQKPKAPWELDLERAKQRAVDQFERDQEFNRAASEIWVRNQQKTSPSGRPPNWEAPPNFSAARPANLRQEENIHRRDRWREAEPRDQKKEAEKQQELQKLQADGSRLAALVYTPEGQQLIEGVRRRLAQIVDAAYENSRPKLVTRMPGSARLPADFEMREQATEAWEQKKQARAEALFRGEGMDSAEIEAYLVSVLGHEPGYTTDVAENQRRRALIEQFDRTRRDIGRALLYQSSEAKPVGQRHLLLSAKILSWSGITTSEAQENFARGWDEIAARPKP